MWDFILSVVTKLVGPCRLVIGRVGRLGHGELKGTARRNLFGSRNQFQTSASKIHLPPRTYIHKAARLLCCFGMQVVFRIYSTYLHTYRVQ